jgi:NAD(P)-dependent dehydrogenase (short-subunit alcohol dehydrogenase family)
VLLLVIVGFFRQKGGSSMTSMHGLAHSIRGEILFRNSWLGRQSNRGKCCGSLFAHIRLSNSSSRLGENNVRVNCICPGGNATPIFGKGFGLATQVADQTVEPMRMILETVQPIPRAGISSRYSSGGASAPLKVLNQLGVERMSPENAHTAS